jgi:hypothetical protein
VDAFALSVRREHSPEVETVSGNLVTFAVALLTSFGAAFAIQRLLQRNVAALLDQIIGLQAGTAFYSRVLGLCLYLAAAAGALGGTFDLKADARFMEYVWKVASVLSNTFFGQLLVLLAFLTLMTVLVTLLRRRG